jgi:hypothetical protein
MVEKPPRVFISYAQYDPAHSRRILALAHALAADGLEVELDQFHGQEMVDWPRWCEERLRPENTDFVLMVSSPEYRGRVEGRVDRDEGRGVFWEGNLIYGYLYLEKDNRRFVPLLLDEEHQSALPRAVANWNTFRLRAFGLGNGDPGYENLYRLLTDQPATPAPEPGQIRRLPPLPAPDLAQVPPIAERGHFPHIIPNPYPGLAAFKPEQCDVFFGRDEDTARIVEKLKTSHLVSVVGASGTGKSSVVAAGVVPALKQQRGSLTYLRFRPQADPLRQLAEALDRHLPEERIALAGPRPERIKKHLERDPAEALRETLGKLSPPILVLADQFEELFTQSSPAAAAAFRSFIEPMLAIEEVLLVLTLRSEFMPRLMDWLGGQLFADSLVALDPIRREDSLRALIARPAEQHGVAVEPALIEALLPAARSMAGSLPLLALTLERLFDKRDPGRGLTVASYREMGGLQSIVATAAADIDAAIESDPALQQGCEKLFSRLATVIDEVPTRSAAEVSPLRADPVLSRLVDALRGQGFLADPDEAHIELAHETLLTHWGLLQDWCARHANDLAQRRQAEQAAKEWQRAREREQVGRAQGQTLSSENLRWRWERQKPALLALLALSQRPPNADPDFTDDGLHAWRALEAALGEPLRSFLAPEPQRLLEELKTDATPHHRREEIGLRLNAMGDPRQGVGLDARGLPDFAWVDIPAGQVTLETGDTFPVGPFRIARYPVTWCQYRAFLDAQDGYRHRRWWRGLRHEKAPGKALWAFANYPAINVSWFDAMAFCRWLSQRTGLEGPHVFRLPTEWEWQWVAANGAAGSAYPWAGDWNPMRANSIQSGVGRTTAVGLYPLGVPPSFPVLDLAGNVWEWCLNRYDQPANTDIDRKSSRVLRGGAWGRNPRFCRAALRSNFASDERNSSFGFRLCCGAPIEPLGAGGLDAETLES